MSGKKLLSAIGALMITGVFATGVMVTTSFAPVLADGPSFGCNAGDDDTSGGTMGDCSIMQNIPVCGFPGNTAFETHRDCTENWSQAEWDASGCGSCHSLERGGMGIGPNCQTCHGVKWDFGDDDDDSSSGYHRKGGDDHSSDDHSS